MRDVLPDIKTCSSACFIPHLSIWRYETALLRCLDRPGIASWSVNVYGTRHSSTSSSVLVFRGACTWVRTSISVDRQRATVPLIYLIGVVPWSEKRRAHYSSNTWAVTPCTASQGRVLFVTPVKVRKQSGCSISHIMLMIQHVTAWAQTRIVGSIASNPL